jgi:DNA-binding NarL/FixJ family response regulator
MRPSPSPAALLGAVAELGERQLDPLALLREVSVSVRRVVPFDAGGFMTVDPETLLPTGSVSIDGSPVLEGLRGGEPPAPPPRGHDAASSPRGPGVGVARGALDHVMAAAARQHVDGAEPLRMLLRAGGSTWGAAYLVRAPGQPLFQLEEARVLAELSGGVARSLRRALTRGGAPEAGPQTAPGMLVLDERLRIVSATREVAYWRERMPQDALATIVGVARVAAVWPEAARARVRLSDGRWLTVQAARLSVGPGELARTGVMLALARRSELRTLLMRLHGLDATERDVIQLLLLGLDVPEVADHLAVGETVVRARVEAAHAKTGTTLRAELRALFDAVPPANPPLRLVVNT